MSPTGVIRPTTRHAILVARPAAVGTLLAATGPLAAIADRVRPSPMEDAPTGLALVDAPDVDSIEHANRVLADRLVESADLAVFVTTGTRYADRVAWDVLERARDRGLPLIVVANRLPADPAERAVMPRRHRSAHRGAGAPGARAGRRRSAAVGRRRRGR